MFVEGWPPLRIKRLSLRYCINRPLAQSRDVSAPKLPPRSSPVRGVNNSTTNKPKKSEKQFHYKIPPSRMIKKSMMLCHVR